MFHFYIKLQWYWQVHEAEAGQSFVRQLRRGHARGCFGVQSRGFAFREAGELDRTVQEIRVRVVGAVLTSAGNLAKTRHRVD